MLVDQAVAQNENFELTKADSLAYNDSTSAVDFETYLANLKLEKSQAVASVGQIELMNLFSQTFSKFKLNISQILLTLDDTEERRRSINAPSLFVYLCFCLAPNRRHPPALHGLARNHDVVVGVRVLIGEVADRGAAIVVEVAVVADRPGRAGEGRVAVGADEGRGRRLGSGQRRVGCRRARHERGRRGGGGVAGGARMATSTATSQGSCFNVKLGIS